MKLHFVVVKMNTLHLFKYKAFCMKFASTFAGSVLRHPVHICFFDI